MGGSDGGLMYIQYLWMVRVRLVPYLFVLNPTPNDVLQQKGNARHRECSDYLGLYIATRCLTQWRSCCVGLFV